MWLWIAIIAATVFALFVAWMVYKYIQLKTSQLSNTIYNTGTSVAASTQFGTLATPNFVAVHVTGMYNIVRQSMPIVGRSAVVRCWSGSLGKLRSGLESGSMDVIVDTSGPGDVWTIQTAGSNTVYITQGDVLSSVSYLSYYIQADNDSVIMSNGVSETTDIVWSVEQDPSNVLYARFSAVNRDSSISSTYLKWNELCDTTVTLVPNTIPNASQLEWRLDKVTSWPPMYASAAPAAASSASRLLAAVSAAIVAPLRVTNVVNVPVPAGSV